MIVLHILIGIALAAGQETAKSTTEGWPMAKSTSESGPMETSSSESAPDDTVKSSTPVSDITNKSESQEDVSKSDSNYKSQSVTGHAIGSVYEHELKYGDLSPVAGPHRVDTYDGIVLPTHERPGHRLYTGYPNPYYTPREEIELRHGITAFYTDHGLGRHRSYRRRDPNRHLDSYGKRRYLNDDIAHLDYAGILTNHGLPYDSVRKAHVAKSRSPRVKWVSIHGRRDGVREIQPLGNSREIYEPIRQSDEVQDDI